MSRDIDQAMPEQIAALLDRRLGEVATATPVFPLALRGYLEAQNTGDERTAEAVIAWMAGQPHVGAAAKRVAGVRGDIDHFLAMGFLQGLLAVLKGARHPGLLVVLDEVETLQRMRSDARAKALNALRQWIDELDAGRYPGLYLMITGTPAFFDGRQGVQGLPPLAARMSTTFSDPRFDNPRAPQIRLPGFDLERLVQVGIRVRDIFADGSPQQARVLELVDDAFLADLATAVAGRLGGAGRHRAPALPTETDRRGARLGGALPGLPATRTRRIGAGRGNDRRRTARRSPDRGAHSGRHPTMIASSSRGRS